MAVANFLGRFGQHEKLLNLLDNSNTSQQRYLIEVAVRLSQSSNVAELLTKDAKLLDDVLKLGIRAIDGVDHYLVIW